MADGKCNRRSKVINSLGNSVYFVDRFCFEHMQANIVFESFAKPTGTGIIPVKPSCTEIRPYVKGI